jgi:hypothetical protein
MVVYIDYLKNMIIKKIHLSINRQNRIAMNKFTIFLIIFMCGLLVRCANSDLAAGFNRDDGLPEDFLITESGNCLPDVTDKYVYPVVPGTTEWDI